MAWLKLADALPELFDEIAIAQNVQCFEQSGEMVVTEGRDRRHTVLRDDDRFIRTIISLTMDSKSSICAAIHEYYEQSSNG